MDMTLVILAAIIFFSTMPKHLSLFCTTGNPYLNIITFHYYSSCWSGIPSLAAFPPILSKVLPLLIITKEPTFLFCLAVKNLISKMILSTDMACHFDYLSKLKALAPSSNYSIDEKIILACCILKTADLCNTVAHTPQSLSPPSYLKLFRLGPSKFITRQ
jgi:hypothetical protein